MEREQILSESSSANIKKFRSRVRGGAILSIIQIFVGGIFIFSAVSKIRQPFDFLSAVYGYEILGPRTGLWLAVFLPWFELVVGFSLAIDIGALGGLIAALGLSIVFVIAQSRAMVLGLDIDCGCFGRAGVADKVGYSTLGRASGLLILVGILLVSQIVRSRRLRAC